MVLRSFSKNHVDVIVEVSEDSDKWRFTGFYGNPFVNTRSESWELVRTLGMDQNL